MVNIGEQCRECGKRLKLPTDWEWDVAYVGDCFTCECGAKYTIEHECWNTIGGEQFCSQYLERV
jgi:hypothetical protein